MKFLSLNTQDMKTSHILICLFLAALIVRVIGINYGYWFGDERINSAAKVLAGELVPGQHYYPPFLNYITAVFFVILYGIGRLFVSWYDLAEFRAQYFTDPTPFYITARFLVCLISAAIAPLFYLVVRECGLKKGYAIVVGLFGVFIPGMVLLSHIAKGDVPLSVCVVLVFYLALKKLKSPESIKLDILMGLAIALALSFKQSYIFILFPFFAAYLLVFYFESKNIALTIKSTVYAAVVSAILWPIMNIGILLDFNNFLDYQKIQTVMSVRENKDIIGGLEKWWSTVASPFFGVNAIVLVVFLVAPTIFLIKKTPIPRSTQKLLLALWASLLFGSFMIVYLSGERQQSGLWVPYMTGMQLIAALVFCYLMMFFSNWKKHLSCIATACILLLSVYGVFIIDKQAIAKPIVLSVEELIRENYDPLTTKFLTSFSLRSPQTLNMSTSEYARHERIADKYNVVMPERAPEKLNLKESDDAINYFNMPSALHGLENSNDDTLSQEEMKPYAWPLQKEEWSLDYWMNQGFQVFILGDHDYAREKSNVDVIRSFNADIKDRCKLIKHFNPTKPLFIEFSATVYQCG